LAIAKHIIFLHKYDYKDPKLNLLPFVLKSARNAISADDHYLHAAASMRVVCGEMKVTVQHACREAGKV